MAAQSPPDKRKNKKYNPPQNDSDLLKIKLSMKKDIEKAIHLNKISLKEWCDIGILLDNKQNKTPSTIELLAVFKTDVNDLLKLLTKIEKDVNSQNWESLELVSGFDLQKIISELDIWRLKSEKAIAPILDILKQENRG